MVQYYWDLISTIW